MKRSLPVQSEELENTENNKNVTIQNIVAPEDAETFGQLL